MADDCHPHADQVSGVAIREDNRKSRGRDHQVQPLEGHFANGITRQQIGQPTHATVALNVAVDEVVSEANPGRKVGVRSETRRVQTWLSQ